MIRAAEILSTIVVVSALNISAILWLFSRFAEAFDRKDTP
ncbi:hypothetical protein SAMN05519103_06262 [Rhizobiales bacterium GAS113]|nr:hypothetical protein SAMN05519103_06262 [Rhizobiales bacterium GAS113]